MAQNVVLSGGNPARIGIPAFVQFGQSRRRSAFQAAFGVFFAPIPGDSIGAFSLTLENVVVGSAIRVESLAGTTLYSGTATLSTVVISLAAYAPGDALNDLRIKVRKGTSSPYYQPFETLASAFVGAQSIYVSQIPDE